MPQIEEAVRDVRGRWLDDLARICATRCGASGIWVLCCRRVVAGPGNSRKRGHLHLDQWRDASHAAGGRTAASRADHAPHAERSFPDSFHIPYSSTSDNVRSISAAFAQWTTDESIVVEGEEDFVRKDLVSGEY